MTRREMDRGPSDPDYHDGGGIEDYEDSTRATRPSEHGRTLYSDDNVQMLVDAIIVKLRRRKVPFRIIGKILNRGYGRVADRFAAIPTAARKHYEKLEMG